MGPVEAERTIGFLVLGLPLETHILLQRWNIGAGVAVKNLKSDKDILNTTLTIQTGTAI